MAKARKGQLLGAQATAGMVGGLEHDNRHARLGETDRGDEAVRPRADNHRINVGHTAKRDIQPSMGRRDDRFDATGRTPERGPTMTDQPPTRGVELAALGLMSIGGVLLPLGAPAVGVMVMRSVPRWTDRDVGRCWLILGIGLVGLIAGAGLLAAGADSTALRQVALALMGTAVVAGPAAAVYAASRPRLAGSGRLSE